jgi:hypothetical protein
MKPVTISQTNEVGQNDRIVEAFSDGSLRKTDMEVDQTQTSNRHQRLFGDHAA